jgi:hypothetical protein
LHLANNKNGSVSYEIHSGSGYKLNSKQAHYKLHTANLAQTEGKSQATGKNGGRTEHRQINIVKREMTEPGLISCQSDIEHLITTHDDLQKKLSQAYPMLICAHIFQL